LSNDKNTLKQPAVLPLVYGKQKDIILWVLPWTINLCRICFFFSFAELFSFPKNSEILLFTFDLFQMGLMCYVRWVYRLVTFLLQICLFGH